MLLYRIIIYSMGNHQQPSSNPSSEFSFQPLLSYRLAKSIPTTLIPAKQLQQQLPYLDWSLIGVKRFGEKDQWEFLNNDWSLKRRWKVLLFASQDHYQQGVYDENLLIPQKSVFKQIDKDVKRTYPTRFFQDQENINIFSRVLKNIANYFPDSGYTQGVNFVIGFLLQCGFKEEETFWIFIHMALNPNIFIMGYYEQEFPLANLSHDLFMLLMRQYYPKLAANILKLLLPKQIWVFQWFLTFYLNSFPADMCKLFWDYILVSEPFGIVYLALGIIDQTYDHLIKLKQDSDFGLFFQNLRNREVLCKTLNLDKLFAKAKQLTLTPSALAMTITRVSQVKGYNSFYAKYYSQYDNPQKSQVIYQKFLREVKKQRLLFKVNANRSNMIRSQKAMNPIQFCMSQSIRIPEKTQNIPSLVLLKHIRQEQSKRMTDSNVNDEDSTQGYYFKYPNLSRQNNELLK